MKTVNEILSDISAKIKEHSSIIEEIDSEFKMFSSNNGQSVSSQIQVASKKLVLKDKMLFHKAAILVLNDLKDSING